MTVDAVTKERNNKIEIFSPKFLRGRPVHTLPLKFRGRTIRLVTSFDDVLNDKYGCVCDQHSCGFTDYPNTYLRTATLPRNSIITCICNDTVYIIVPEVFIK